MVLQVPFAQFAASLDRVLQGCKDVYVAPHQQQSLVTASKAGVPVVVATVLDMQTSQAIEKLKGQGLNAFEGRWNADLSLEHEGDDLMDIYIAGVAYRADAGPPGIWVDAFGTQPTQVQVLKGMYDEMMKTGQMTEVSFEEFVRLSDANVVILGPNDLRSFIAEKDPL